MSASEMDEQAQGIYVSDRDAFKRNAAVIFDTAVQLVAGSGIDGGDNLLDQMLHSILFLGNIYSGMSISPREIFDNDAMFHRTQNDFRNAFERHRTDVPLRTPFSYFLELVVKFYGEDNEVAVKEKLAETLQKCKKFRRDKYPLISAVMCICQASESSRRYYGASLACPGYIERHIMIALSCLHVWHPYVSSAVLDVFPEDTTEPRFEDGTIRLPASVVCRAFDIKALSVVKPPCKRCRELYSLPTLAINRNLPGNCAETEAISSLLANEENVKNETQIYLKNYFKEQMNERMKKRENHSYNINRTYRRMQSFTTRFYNLRLTQPISTEAYFVTK